MDPNSLPKYFIRPKGTYYQRPPPCTPALHTGREPARACPSGSCPSGPFRCGQVVRPRSFQVLTTLISNAFDATQAGGSVDPVGKAARPQGTCPRGSLFSTVGLVSSSRRRRAAASGRDVMSMEESSGAKNKPSSFPLLKNN